VPIDYFFNKSLDDLILMLARVQERQTVGGLRDVMVPGVRTRREFDKEQNSVQEIERIRYSMFLRAQAGDPGDGSLIAQYPNPYLEKTRRTRTRYLYS
jgi:hypothetical protein